MTKSKQLTTFLGKAIHPNFTKEDEDVYYLKSEADEKIKVLQERINQLVNNLNIMEVNKDAWKKEANNKAKEIFKEIEENIYCGVDEDLIRKLKQKFIKG